MSISPEIRQNDFKGSIKKYFLDTLEVIEGIKLFFDGISDTPVNIQTGEKLNSWIIISFGDRNLGTVSDQFILLDLFTRKDDEGDDLSILTDTVLNYIINENNTNGLVTIPYYNVSVVPWVLVGGIIPFIEPLQQSFSSKDDTKIQNITLRCKWGGK